MIVEKVVSGEDESLRGKIDQFFESQRRIQQISNPSGSLSTGGLAEPKFNINETAFTDPWGTFTRSGCCSRRLSTSNKYRSTPKRWPSSASLHFHSLRQLADCERKHHLGHREPMARPQVGPRLRSKLLEPFDVRIRSRFTFCLLTRSSFDLWEEVNSSSFFTTAVQHRSLREGAALAEKLGQTDVISGYSTQADNILCFQQVHISYTTHQLSPVDRPFRPTKIPQAVTLPPTLAAVALELIPTPFSPLSTSLTQPQDVTLRRSNHAPMSPYPT